jgi:hypothetical protein
MKNFNFYTSSAIILVLVLVMLTSSNLSIDKKAKTNFEIVKTNIDGKGTGLSIEFTPGKSHNHPTMAVWIEDMNENFIQTLYVSKSVATGIFAHGEKDKHLWQSQPGAVRRPATLPYFLHKRNIMANDGTYLPTPENTIPDALRLLQHLICKQKLMSL